MWKTKFGKCIYTSPSGYKVYQNLFYRWLTLGSTALQTVINRRKPHIPILYYIPALTLMARMYPGTICLLGLGGAGIGLMLPKATIVAVEISEEVIDIAKYFFFADKLNHLTIVCNNALSFVKTTEETYPHLIIDLYSANHFPPECAHDEFFISCKRIITEDGFLAINLANINEQWTIFRFVKKHFSHTLVIPIKNSSNMIILASKSTNKELFLNKINETQAFRRIIWVENWGYVGEYKMLPRCFLV